MAWFGGTLHGLVDDAKAASILADASLLRRDLGLAQIEALADRSAARTRGAGPVTVAETAAAAGSPPAEEPDDIVRDAEDGHADGEAPDAVVGTEEATAAPWRAAEALKALRRQVDAAYPKRLKGNDGTVGDAAHQTRASDHNPWIVDGDHRVVSAIDITNDPAHGCDANRIVAALHASRDRRIKYLIWNRRIASATAIGRVPAWTWRAYGGANPHDHHFHLSVKPDKKLYDDTSDWTIVRAEEGPEAVAAADEDQDAALAAAMSLLGEGAERDADLLERLVAAQETVTRLVAIHAQSTALAEEFTEAPPPSFASFKPSYEQLFATADVTAERKATVGFHTAMLRKGRTRYEQVQAKTGAPWWFVGIVHAMEASFSFTGHLHNGDPLTARTVQVPQGRPKIWNPPSDWLSSAVDAITMSGYAGLTDWTLARVLFRFERYNGFAYHSKGINSPYLWSFSNHYSKGKFVKDGVFSPYAVSKQCGAAVMLRALVDAGEIADVPR